MKVNQVQTVMQPLVIECLQRLQKFRRRKPELGSIAATVSPFAGTAGCQLDADTEVRLYVQFLCCTCNEVDFIEFLYYDEDALTHLLCQQSQFYIALVLVSVTDNERIALALYGNHCM